MVCLLRTSPQHLESEEFRALITTLAGEQYDTPNSIQSFMAFIVDFTIIMQAVFGLVVNARLHLSRRLIKLAFAMYNNSVERRQVHNDIRDHVKLAGRTDRDAALAEMLRLFKNYQMNAEDMDWLQIHSGGGD